MSPKKSPNPDGRPKEYSGELKTISLSLPKRLLANLDRLADDAGISRQRLIVEWLTMAQTLEWHQYLWTTSEGTFFDEWPERPPKIANMTRTPFTYRDAVEWFTRWAEVMPDELVKGMEFRVYRDEASTKDAGESVQAEETKQKRKPRKSSGKRSDQ